MLAFRSPATEILYGGAKGGGKSYLMRVCAITWALQVPGLQIYIFRRTSPQLRKSHMIGRKRFPEMLIPLSANGLVQIVADQIRFYNGSVIHLCHCQYDHEVEKYAGVEMHVLMIDQLEQFSETIYRRLRAEVRMVGIDVPAEMKQTFPRVLNSDNPGGIGDSWIMQTWRLNIGDQSSDPGPVFMGAAGLTRQFIPARLEDNPSLVEEDPGYELRLGDLGNPDLVNALRYGVRGMISGSFFADVWNRPDYQILPPFTIPARWRRFASFDWGSAKPASLGVWTEASGEEVAIGGRKRWFPRGSMIRVAELYTVVRNGDQIDHNVGQRIGNKELGRLVGLTCSPFKARTIFADPQVFDATRSDDGSIGDQMSRGAKSAGYEINFERGDNARVAGWQKLRKMMGESGSKSPEGPGVWAVSSCRDSLRTLPGCQIDPARGGEDLKKQGEDHAADEWRYAAMTYDSGRLESVAMDLM